MSIISLSPPFSNFSNFSKREEDEENDPNEKFEETSKFKNFENSNSNYEDSGNKAANDILDQGEREGNYSKNNENPEDEDEEHMDYDNNHYYQENAYKNLQKNQDFNAKPEYEVVNVEHQLETEDDPKFAHSDENMAKTPESNFKNIFFFFLNNSLIENEIKQTYGSNFNTKDFNELRNVGQSKELEQKIQGNQTQNQPTDINFFKLKNSKLFQKFLKEEGGQVPKKSPNNFFSNPEEQQQPASLKPNIDPRKNNAQPPPPNKSQENLKKIEKMKNEEIPRKVTPIKQERTQEPDDKYMSRKSNNNEEDKELAGYSQIVPG